MGLIGHIMGLVFGGNRNVVAETVEVFKENAEKGAVRDADKQAAALAQFAKEFGVLERSNFDRVIDGLNRLPRPMLALGTIGLFVAAMGNPDWFAARMLGVATIPEPLWWLMGAIVSFYFGARYQLKGQDFQAKVVKAVADAQGAGTVTPSASGDYGDNPALLDWQAQLGR